MTDINIENIVASAQVSGSFDVEMLSEKMPGSSYNPDEFDGLTIKFESPKTAVLVLGSGKLICTGAKNQNEVDTSMKNAIVKIESAGFKVKKTFKTDIENIVASTDLNKQIDLEDASKGLIIQNVIYDPKDFPGLIYKADLYGSILILFSSGKIVCTGAKKLEDATKAIDMLKDKLTSIGVL